MERDHTDDIAGTLFYMAPELLQGAAASAASDLYALGMVAYEVFTGRRPYPLDFNHLVQSILYEPISFEPLSDTPAQALEAVLRRLLHKSPAQRYASATAVIIEVRHAAGLATPPENPIHRESFLQSAQFVGRQEELRRMQNALVVSEQHIGSAWLLAGESGVGKSRFLGELWIHALVRGHITLTGQAVEGGGPPYSLWREALQRLVLSVQVSEFEASVLQPLIPTLPDVLGHPIHTAPALSGEADQQRISFTVLDVCRRLPRPTVLLLEDLHWAQEEDLTLLRALTDNLAELPLVVFASYRDDEHPELPTRLPRMQVQKLHRLNAAEISTLSAAMLGEVGQRPEIVGLIERETEGNPFFVVEVVRALAEKAGTLAAIDTVTLPSSMFAAGIREIVTRRLERLPSEARALLRLAAVSIVVMALVLVYLLLAPHRRRHLPLVIGLLTGLLLVEQRLLRAAFTQAVTFGGAFYADENLMLIPMVRGEALSFLVLFVLLLAVYVSLRRMVTILGALTVMDVSLILLLHRWSALLVFSELVEAVVRLLVALLVGSLATSLLRQRGEQQARLAQANAELSRHAATVEQLTISRERNRLAHELHDTLAHTLSAVTVKLNAVNIVWDTHPDKSRVMLREVIAALNDGMGEVRRALRDLRASPLEELGLALALRQLAESAAQRGHFSIEVGLPAAFDGLLLEDEQGVYRIVQEALTNVVKHAEARHVSFTAEMLPGGYRWIIRDDGRGFDTSRTVSESHFGLQGMVQRALLMRGRLSVASHPGQGTTVTLMVEKRA